MGDFDAGQPAPGLPGVWEVKPERAARLFSQRINTGGACINGSVNTGGGDFVGRDRIATATGGGVSIGGSVTGSTIVTGDDNIVGSQVSVQANYLNQIDQAIDERPGTSPDEKADLKAEVAENQKEDSKGEGADESLIVRRLRSIQHMPPTF